MKTVQHMSLVALIIIGILSCSDDHRDFIPEMIPLPDASLLRVDDLEQLKTTVETTPEIHKDEVVTRSSTTYYYPSPQAGQCGKTIYTFYLRDYGNDPLRQLILQLPSGNTVYLQLSRWTDYQFVSLRMYGCGDVSWSFVDDAQQALIGTYNLPNTGVSIAPLGVSHLGWPYKSDGSSWQNKAGWWEAIGSPYHTGTDAHAQDWNWGSGYDDDGKVLTAPFCGKVVFAGWHSNCYGNIVDLVHYAGTQKVMHRIAHMKDVDVSVGQWISRADRLGTLGNSGSSTCSGGPWTPHTHCVLYKLNANESIVSGLEYEYSY
jgi:hypothetical protein